MDPKKTIVIVDDEPSIRQLIKIFLIRYRFNVLEASCAKDLYNILDSNKKVDLIVLDLMLPDVYGIDICRKIRETSSIPIIMLTAAQGEMNTVLGFEAGADDYVEKPFSAHILLARIQAVLKRAKTKTTDSDNNDDIIIVDYENARFGQWTYLPEESYVIHSSERHIFLTKTECSLLELFLSKEQEILSRERIAKALNINYSDSESRAIDVQVSRLRNKLRDKSQSNLIKSIRNKGYVLSVPVRFNKN